jgi:hypothetical protein
MGRPGFVPPSAGRGVAERGGERFLPVLVSCEVTGVSP